MSLFRLFDETLKAMLSDLDKQKLDLELISAGNESFFVGL